MRVKARRLLPLALFAVLAGCGGSNDRYIGPIANGLEYRLTSDRAIYAPGQPVVLTFTVMNHSTLDASGTVGGCEEFDIAIVHSGRTIWQRSSTGGCGGVVVPISVTAGSTRKFTYTWDQTDQQGLQVPTGKFILNSWFTRFNPNDSSITPFDPASNQAAKPIQIIIQ